MTIMTWSVEHSIQSGRGVLAQRGVLYGCIPCTCVADQFHNLVFLVDSRNLYLSSSTEQVFGVQTYSLSKDKNLAAMGIYETRLFINGEPVEALSGKYFPLRVSTQASIIYFSLSI
jgi:hypothetical protein